MRQKRAKQYRKQMLVYNHTFKFREPYQVIVDDQLVLKCDQASFDLQKGLARTIQAEVKPMITQCCMQELYKVNNQSAIELARTFERRRCNHPPTDPLPPHECLKSIVIVKGQNKHRYVVATENEKLRWSLRKVPGIPLIYMNRSVMVMEPLSKASAQISNTQEKSKLTGGLNDVNGGVDEKESKETASSKKRKGPKEPNPLSIKKKKKEDTKSDQEKNDADNEGKKKRRRKHKKSSADGEDEDEDDNEHEESKAVPQTAELPESGDSENHGEDDE